MSKYIECAAREIPPAVRWDTPRRNQGQIVETSYGDFGRAAPDDGAPFMRREDRSLPVGDPARTTHYRRSDG